MTSSPRLIDCANLSLAWSAAFQTVDGAPGKEVAPLIVSFTGVGAEIEETAAIRSLIDGCLTAQGMQSVNTVANTIFPQSVWRFVGRDRSRLYEEYLENLPHYVSMEPHKNRKGTYFARLIAFNVDPKTGSTDASVNIPSGVSNQLEFLIEHCRAGKRRSYLQAAVFDPNRDHTSSAQLGFPCLQHISVVPNFNTKSLELNAFYATQQLFDKAYGNFLGLARLGRFIAGAADLELERVTCFIGVEKMDRRPLRGQLEAFRQDLQRLLDGATYASIP